VQAPLTISVNSPLELVQQFFVKLGARYVVITDANGFCELFLSFFFDGP
jgi:chloride channel 3/4/5